MPILNVSRFPLIARTLVCLWLCSFTGNVRTDEPLVEPFPTVGLLPKRATGAMRFLEQHPEYDGRGVTVAIFDTGVDPGAAGLSQTSDGRPKIVDLVDATGDGDVLLSEDRQAEDGKLEGLTGRALTIDPDWSNPSGNFRLGMKAAYELYPPELIDRLNGESRDDWDEPQAQRRAELEQQLLDWDEQHPDPTAEQLKQREEIQDRIDVLAEALDNYEDPGPIYDCVVFHDGDVWRAVIDTDEDGDLTDEQPLTDYHREHEFAAFGETSQLNFSVNIYEDGRRLSIVTVSGSHGTHVAGIVAASYPEHPERNGLAPGAQLVSVKIGDNRIDGMETGRALVRGLRAVIDRQCDLINMSYGEPTSTPDRGRLTELFSEIVREHGVIFVASAGNAGPALSTVGAPGGTTEALLGIGAYVSPEMMSPQYGLRETLDGMPYTWSSRGPTTDGAIGVDLFAPGGAFSPVPNYELRRSMQANGTSMASPNACGNIALLLSKLKAEKIEYTPALVRHALKNTAEYLPGVGKYAQGAGLIRIDRASEWLQEGDIPLAEKLPYDVEVGADGARGVYLREREQTQKPLETAVSIMPHFEEDSPKEAQVDFEIPITLEATAEWVDASESMLLTAAGESFELLVDPRKLDEGLHTAEVRGYHAGRESRGPLFRVPVTVIKPQKPADPFDAREERSLTLSPGHLERQFVTVPEGATWVDIELELEEADSARRFMLHTVQLLPGHSFEDGESNQFLVMEEESTTVRSIPVVDNRTIEICLAQYWSSLGESKVSMSVEFRGLLPDNDELTLPSDGSPREVSVASHVHRERCQPSGSFDTLRRLYRPESVDEEPLLADRDRQLDGTPTNRLLLIYKFTQPTDGHVTIGVPKLNGLLYDSPVGGQEWQLFDANKRLMTTDDMYPEELSLDEGEYTLRMEIRHADPSVLEEFKAIPISVDRALTTSPSVHAYATRADAAADGDSFETTWLDPGETATMFLTGPAADELPDHAAPGDILRGTITYVDSPTGTDGARSRPGGYPVTFVVPPLPEETNDSPSAKPTDEQPLAERLKKERVDLLIDQLGELALPDDEELFDELGKTIREIDPEAEQRILVARLHLLDNDDRKQRLGEVVAAADDVIATIKQPQLARRLTLRANADRPKTVKQRERAEKQRDILVDALYRKGRALAYHELPDVVKEHPIEDQEALDKAFEENFRELSRWVDPTESDYYLLTVRRDRREGRYGTALKLLNEHISDASPPKRLQHKKRRDIYEQLGWDDWRAYEQRWMLIDFPEDWPPF